MSWRLVLVLLAGACTSSSSPSDAWDPSWEVVFEDAFDGPAGTAPDPSVWTPDVGGDGWGNSQLEYDTDRVENAALSGDGMLQILAIREAYEGNSWTSARLTTRNGLTHGYGRFEASIRFPAGDGLWPAFWLLGANIDTVGWPACGEIDIVELRGSEPQLPITTLHGPGYSGGEGIGRPTTLPEGEDAATVFHTYAVEIDPGHVAWFIDDALVHKVHAGDLPDGSAWVFDQEMFMILNLAVGGHFLEPPNGETPSPAIMEVDWVRVLERKSG